MVFTNHDGIQPLLKGKLKLGGDASVAAGPVGRKAEVGTDILLKSAIYSYSAQGFVCRSFSGWICTLSTILQRECTETLHRRKNVRE
jgi:lipid-binding SYLF domain-containing protein